MASLANQTKLTLSSSCIRALYGPRIPCRLLHITSSLSKQRSPRVRRNTPGPSRTRLSKDVAPTPPKPQFVRDSLPHEGAKPPDRGGGEGTLRRKERNERLLTSLDQKNGRGFLAREGKYSSTKTDRTSRGTTGAVSRPRVTLAESSMRNGVAGKDWALRRAKAESNRNAPTPLEKSEFDTPSTVSTSTSTPPSTAAFFDADPTLPRRFTSPPLLPGFIPCLQDMIGQNGKPTPIQALSMKNLIPLATSAKAEEASWKQFLLASETGSGKSIAYLLPLLQALKTSEAHTNTPRSSSALFSTTAASSVSPVDTPSSQDPGQSDATSVLTTKPIATTTTATTNINPRALILAPTHELSRQLAGFAKGLVHVEKLRVVCVSRANNATRGGDERQIEEKKDLGRARDADVLVGTPMKILEMLRGRRWDEDDSLERENDRDDKERKYRKGRDANVSSPPATGRRGVAPSDLGLQNIEWVVIDEADILLDPDFVKTTELLLSDISSARSSLLPRPASSSSSSSTPATSEAAIKCYPFNLILTSATIPNSLSTYLSTHHPSLVRLASPGIHHLPKTLKVEYSAWSGGNKFADVERRVRQVWEDQVYGTGTKTKNAGGEEAGSGKELTKVLVFCNKNSRVEGLGEYLRDKGIKNIALTSTGDIRRKGSNKHLDGFLKTLSSSPSPSSSSSQSSYPPSSSKDVPRVLITTSLLSRGLDFSPDIKHVFIVDEPRNMIDFLHRAGRSARAGKGGTVVVFGKVKGRGSMKMEGVKRRVGGLR